ncbi:MAG: alpha/beta hydrolase [Acidimicrobiales bacterium]|nr:alpha/beta hydrolase [Acidimicrobiales bacterium]
MTSFAPSGAAQIAYDDEGSGPPALFLHAGVTDRRSWRAVVDDLQGSRRCLAFDQRKFGETSYTPEPHSTPADAVAVLDHAGVDEPVAVVGCSMGGTAAMDLALLHPERVERLVLMAPGVRVEGVYPDTIPDSWRDLVASLEAAEEAGDLDEVNRLEAHLWLDGPTAPEGRVGGAARERFLAMNGRALAAEDPGGTVGVPELWEGLEQLTIPVLVLVGDLDTDEEQGAAEQLAAMIPGARFERLDSTAHLPQIEAHPRLLEVVAEFLA